MLLLHHAPEAGSAQCLGFPADH